MIAVGGSLYMKLTEIKKPLLADVVLNQQAENTDAPQVLNPRELFVNNGLAPEFTGATSWLNGEPQTLIALRGQVTLVHFWAYSSISSIRNLSHVNSWLKKYEDRGFKVVGIHTPQFNFEKVPTNIESAIKRYAIPYPIALDNNYKTWNAYHNQFWPAIYLIDKDGNIVYTQYGEGNYDRTEKAIRTLVGIEGSFNIPTAPQASFSQTPDINFGLVKLNNFGGAEKPIPFPQIYVFPSKLAKNKFALEGNWVFNQESALHTKGYARIKLNFTASKVFIVGQSVNPVTLKVYVDGRLEKGVVIKDSDLYQLYDSDAEANHTMEIEIQQDGFEAFAFTFE